MGNPTPAPDTLGQTAQGSEASTCSLVASERTRLPFRGSDGSARKELGRGWPVDARKAVCNPTLLIHPVSRNARLGGCCLTCTQPVLLAGPAVRGKHSLLHSGSLGPREGWDLFRAWTGSPHPAPPLCSVWTACVCPQQIRRPGPAVSVTARWTHPIPDVGRTEAGEGGARIRCPGEG